MVALLVVVFMVSGCSGTDQATADESTGDQSADGTTDDTGSNEQDAESGDGSDAENQADSGDGDSAQVSTGGDLYQGVAELDGLQGRDESGVVITLNRLVVEPSYVVLEFSAANGSSGKVALAGNSNRGIAIDLGSANAVLTYQAPSRNETLELSSGEVLEGEIVFLGILPSNIDAMDVTFNPEPEAEVDVAEPTIRFVDVPLTIETS